LKIRFLPEAEAIEVLKDIMRGLQEMMKHNIIHRDLKPANIIKHNSTYKIGDFGFSRNFEQLQMMESLVGTPLYMAP
jgi:serine/threonine protein kinase